MSDYSQLALKDLAAHGLTPDSLILRYPQELKRFRLACNMGETGIQLDESSLGEHPLLPAAYAWLKLASTWPPQASIAGIDLPVLESAFTAELSEEGLSIQEIPQELQNESLRLIAVKQYGGALAYIPIDKQTKVIQLVAVSQNGAAIQYIPLEQQSEDMRLIAVSLYAEALSLIPLEHRSESVMCAAVSKDGYALRHIPLEQQTEAIRLAAVKRHGDVLSMIPKDLQSIAVQRAALKNSRSAIRYMQEKIATRLLQELNGGCSEPSP